MAISTPNSFFKKVVSSFGRRMPMSSKLHRIAIKHARQMKVTSPPKIPPIIKATKMIAVMMRCVSPFI